MRRLLIGAVLVAVLAGLASGFPIARRLLADPAGGRPVVGVTDVTVAGTAFAPPVVEVTAGTEVTWTFADGDLEHNVVGDGFTSDVASTGTFAHTFARPGSHPYRCTLHVGMEGRVEVVS